MGIHFFGDASVLELKKTSQLIGKGIRSLMFLPDEGSGKHDGGNTKANQ
jgi:hypothetical protein